MIRVKIHFARLLILFYFIYVFVDSLSAQIKVGNNPTKINPSSLLELESNTRGILLSRLSDTLLINSLDPPDGTLIYLATSSTSTSGVYLRRNRIWELLGSGGTGMTNGREIRDVLFNTDSTFSFLFTDGSIYKSPFRTFGRDGVNGLNGKDGKGIQNIIVNPDSTLSINYTDGTTFISRQKIIGKDGRNGIDGANGRGIDIVQLNADSTFSIIYTDGTSFTSVQKVIGRNGERGIEGRGIQNISIRQDSSLQILYSDGTSFQSSQRIIGKDGTNGKGILWQGSLGSPPNSPELNWAYFDTLQNTSFIYNGVQWNILAKGTQGNGSGIVSLFNGNRPITASVFNGQNPGTNDIGKWLEDLFYPSQGPLAGLSMTYLGTTSNSFTLEQMAPGADLSVTLNWTAGRQSSTANLATVNIAGGSVTFTQPGAGGSVSGSQSNHITRNVNTNFSNTVTTVDNKTASTSVGMNFSWKRYYGFLDGPADGVSLTVTNAQILSLAQGFGSGKNFSANFTPTGSQRLVIAYPLSWDGTNTQILIGGLDQTGAFERTVQSFTNASGAITNYVIYASINNTNGSVNFSIQ